MQKYILLIILFACSLTNSFSQDKNWLDKSKRDSLYPRSEYFAQYYETTSNTKLSDSKNISEALDQAKNEFSKMLTTEITTSSNSSTIRREAVYESVYNQKSSSSSSATISGLIEDHTFTFVAKKKMCHIFIYIKKSDYKEATINQFNDLLISIRGDVNTCRKMYIDQNYIEAKLKGDEVVELIKNLSNKKSLLAALNVEYNVYEYTNLVGEFEPLFASIKKQISDEQDYKKNKDKGDLNKLSNDKYDLEIALEYYSKAQSLNPALAITDELQEAINEIETMLFKKYCQEAVNLEAEAKYGEAIKLLKKARELNQNGEFQGEKLTNKIIACQDKLIDTLIAQGQEEFDDNPNIALGKFNDAKILITSMNRNDRIKEINKLVTKAEKEVKKRKNKEDRELRRGRVKTQRDKSPHRILFSVGGGFQNEYTDHSDIFSNPINVDIDKWHISSTLGYRLNLPTEIITSKSGFEKSKGNVLAIFYKQGNTLTNYPDGSGQTKTAFSEFEFGYIFKERIRVSLGKGNRSFPANNSELLPPSSYNCATASWYMHFGRLSVEPSITYLLNEKLAFEQAKFNANFSLRFYLYKKIYKTTKDQIK